MGWGSKRLAQSGTSSGKLRRCNLKAMSVGDVALPVSPRRKPDATLDSVSATTHDSVLRCASEMRGKINSTQ